MICPKCGRPVPNAAVICPGCDFILDTDFLGTEILDEDQRLRPGKGGIEPEVFNLADAVILGDMDEKSQVFDTQDTGFNVKETTSARLYVTGSTQAMMAPDAIPAKTKKTVNKRKLTPFERHLLGYIDGIRPVEAIQREAGLDDAEVKTALATLSDKGLVEVIGRAMVEIEPMQAPQRMGRKKRNRYHPDILGAVAVVGDDTEQAIEDAFATKINVKVPTPEELKGLPERTPLHRPETDVFSRLIDDGGELRLVNTRVERGGAVSLEKEGRKKIALSSFSEIKSEGFTETTKRGRLRKKGETQDLANVAEEFDFGDEGTDALENLNEDVLGLHSRSLLLDDGDKEETKAALVDTSGLFNSFSSSEVNVNSDLGADFDFEPDAFSSKEEEGDDDEDGFENAFNETTRAAPNVLQQALLKRTKLGLEKSELRSLVASKDMASFDDEMSKVPAGGLSFSEKHPIYSQENLEPNEAQDFLESDFEESESEKKDEPSEVSGSLTAASKPSLLQKEVREKNNVSASENVFDDKAAPALEFENPPMTDPAATALISKRPFRRGDRASTGLNASEMGSEELISESMVISPGKKNEQIEPAFMPMPIGLDDDESEEETAILSDLSEDDSESDKGLAGSLFLEDSSSESNANVNYLDENTEAYDDELLDEDGYGMSISHERQGEKEALSDDVSFESRPLVGRPFKGHKRCPIEQAALKKKAARLFADAQEDFTKGRIGAARMNAKLASIYDHENSDYQQALLNWERSVPSGADEKPAEIHFYEQAQEAEAKGAVDDAMRLLRKGLKENPNIPALHNRLGVLLALQKRDYAKAAKYIRKAIELEPENVHYKNNLGKILSRKKHDLTS